MNKAPVLPNRVWLFHVNRAGEGVPTVESGRTLAPFLRLTQTLRDPLRTAGGDS